MGNEDAKRPSSEVEHNERCCMNGAWPGWGPHPDCPGVAALDASWNAAKTAQKGS